ncbi:MAG: TonB-dependent receptor, partial [Kordiimonadaceae bacterium]|nr:TonB-dependent receptor [Kordiimonadaceae bacterium]
FVANAASLFREGGGTFSSQAEADYLFTIRSFETKIEQTVASGIIQGDMFTMPNGSAVPLLLGYEFRRDSILSVPNDIAANGTLFASFTDQGASGTRDLHEFFAETSVQFLKDKTWAEELTLDLGGRVTDESSFDPHFTYSAKLLYRPTSYLMLRGTYGTSYRAPNLRERFLEGATGFQTFTDPCVVPNNAREATDLAQQNSPEVYLSDQDTRSNRVLDACAADGVDPRSLGLEDGTGNAFFALGSAEISTGGSSLLEPETSRSFTYGVVFDQPFTDAFDLRFAVTYFDIDIKNSISEPGYLFVVDECYDNADQPNATSGFCGRIERDETGNLDTIDTTFINAGQETSKGIDFNLTYEQDFEIGSENLNVSLDLAATYTKERFFNILDSTDDIAGETDAPHWRANSLLTLRYNEFRFNWASHFIQGGSEDPDEFDPDAVPCDGLPVSCRPIYFTTDYDVHDMSVSYGWDNYSITFGIKNVFNTAPPEVDDDGVFSLANVPLGIGYDLNGRTGFLTLEAKF